MVRMPYYIVRLIPWWNKVLGTSSMFLANTTGAHVHTRRPHKNYAHTFVNTTGGGSIVYLLVRVLG